MHAPQPGLAGAIVGLIADGTGQVGGLTFSQQLILVSVPATLGLGGSIAVIVTGLRKRAGDRTEHQPTDPSPDVPPDAEPDWHIDRAYVRTLEEDRVADRKRIDILERELRKARGQ